MPKRVYQPKSKKRIRKHGFMARNSTRLGKKVIKKRVLKGRKVLAIS